MEDLAKVSDFNFRELKNKVFVVGIAGFDLMNKILRHIIVCILF